MSQIVLDAEAFKALSSDTRLQILKALDARPLTVSELGRLLALNKATVFEHLKQLVTAGLVKKGEDERKWVYYRLTWKGRNVLHPENVQFMLLLGTALLSVGGLVAELLNLLGWLAPVLGTGELDARFETPRGGDETGKASDAAPAPQQAAGQAADSPVASSPAASPAPSFNSRDDGTSPAGPLPEKAAASSDADALPWRDPHVWLFVLLALLILVSALFLFQYGRERRRERTAMRARLDHLPPEPVEPGASVP